MYHKNELAVKFAEALGLPKHLTRYKLSFAHDRVPIVRCELELHEEDGSIKVEDGKILTVCKKFKIHAEEIKEEEQNENTE